VNGGGYEEVEEVGEAGPMVAEEEEDGAVWRARRTAEAVAAADAAGERSEKMGAELAAHEAFAERLLARERDLEVRYLPTTDVCLVHLLTTRY